MRRLVIGGLILAAAAAAVVIAATSNGDPDATAGAALLDGGTPPRSRSPGVVARALGKIEAASGEIGVSSDITGRISEILVDEGDRVDEGAPLVRLEPFVYRARVEAARAAVAQALAKKKLLDAGARKQEIEVARALLEETKASERLARQSWDRTKQLIDAGIVSENERDAALEEYESARSRVSAAGERLDMALHQTRSEEIEAAAAELAQKEHELSMAEAELEKTVLRAPIAGTVVRKNMRVGEAVSSFQVAPVVTLADLSRLRVRAEVDEIDIAKVRVGQAVEIQVLARPKGAFRGKVFRLGKAMGRRKTESNDPNEREDVRILEVLVDIDLMDIDTAEGQELPLGLRLTVSFLGEGRREE